MSMEKKREDKVLECRECGNKFVWSEEEQELYEERDLSKPSYCPICRGKFEAEKKFKEKVEKIKKEKKRKGK